MKRARHEKPYTFNKKGNEEQATFNARVDETLAEAQADLPTAGKEKRIYHVNLMKQWYPPSVLC